MEKPITLAVCFLLPAVLACAVYLQQIGKALRDIHKELKWRNEAGR